MTRTVPILSETLLARNWGTLKRYEIDYQHSDGTRQVLNREVYDHGHAASVLLHDPVRDNVVLVRQFRLPAQINGDNPYMIEVCAGMLESDDPEACAQREVLEETGIAVEALRYVGTAIASPGSLTEKSANYIGNYKGPALVGKGKGLQEEGEDIEVIELPFNDAFGMIATGAITDAMTIILLQALKLERLEKIAQT